MRAIAANHERCGMSCIRIAKKAAGNIEHGVEKSDEAIAGDAAAKQPVDGGTQFLGRDGRRSESSHGRLQVRHQQSGGHSFSGNVRDAEAESVLIEAQDVVIVSAYDSSRTP